jgi:hypothetical protein
MKSTKVTSTQRDLARRLLDMWFPLDGRATISDPDGDLAYEAILLATTPERARRVSEFIGALETRAASPPRTRGRVTPRPTPPRRAGRVRRPGRRVPRRVKVAAGGSDSGDDPPPEPARTLRARTAADICARRREPVVPREVVA